MPPKALSRRALLMLWRKPEATPSASPSEKPKSGPRTQARAAPARRVRRNKLLPLGEPVARRSAERTPRSEPLLPPGALPGAAFADTCDGSGRCVDACPVQAISLSRRGTPEIDPSVSACVLCDGFACTRVCPSGALLPVTSASEVRMGTARIEPALCTAYRGLPCRICYEVCPVPGVLALAGVDRRRKHEPVPKERRAKTDRRRVSRKAKVPVAGAQACVGCGVCQSHCPSKGAIVIVPLAGSTPRKVEIAAKHRA